AVLDHGRDIVLIELEVVITAASELRQEPGRTLAQVRAELLIEFGTQFADRAIQFVPPVQLTSELECHFGLGGAIGPARLRRSVYLLGGSNCGGRTSQDDLRLLHLVARSRKERLD